MEIEIIIKLATNKKVEVIKFAKITLFLLNSFSLSLDKGIFKL